MKPLTLSPQEVEQAKTGKVTLVRPVEPQPDEDGLSFHKFWEAWFDTSEKSYLSPFGKVGDEFEFSWNEFGEDDMMRSVYRVKRLILIHKGTTVEKRDGQWVFISDMEAKNEPR